MHIDAGILRSRPFIRFSLAESEKIHIPSKIRNVELQFG